MTDPGQLQPDDTLVDRGVDDVFDEGMSPAERLRGSTAKGVTPWEEITGETLDERIAQEEPEPEILIEDDDERDDPSDGYAGADRSGRLIAPDHGADADEEPQLWGTDVGIDAGAASAEEAAVHVIDEADLPDDDPLSLQE